MSLNLNHPEFFQNPYPYYAQLRSTGRPFWLPHEQESSSQGVWLFSRHADALTIFKQTTTISKNIHAIRPPGTSTPFDLHVLHRDGADHLRLRRLVADYFSVQHLNHFESRIENVADTLVRGMKEKSAFNLIADFAEQMPLLTIANLIGVPAEDMPQVRTWSLALGEGFDSVLTTREVLERQKQALLAFLDYAREMIETKRRRPDNSLLGYITAAETEGKITHDELIAMTGFLLFSGHETTINLIGNGLWLLLSNPDQWQLLQREPKHLSSAIEEILRYESPEQRTSFRITLEPLEINGTRMEPGQQIGVIIGAANRDDEAFANPDVFDIQRNPQRHLAFGLGMHNCLGKTLARTEARIAFSKIMEHMPALRLVESRPSWRKNSFFRGLESLPARLD